MCFAEQLNLSRGLHLPDELHGRIGVDDRDPREIKPLRKCQIVKPDPAFQSELGRGFSARLLETLTNRRPGALPPWIGLDDGSGESIKCLRLGFWVWRQGVVRDRPGVP